MEIVAKLKDLVKQATIERSHFYVASTCRDAIKEIEMLRAQNKKLDYALGRIVDDVKAALHTSTASIIKQKK